MNQRTLFRRLSVAGVLLATTLTASALSLGRVRGAALIGQPLELSVPVTLESGDNFAASCFAVDLLYGDARVGDSRVTLTLAPGPDATSGSLVVRSAAIVDEPIVTLFVKVLCGQDVTRRYVVLPDLAPIDLTPAAPVAVPQVNPASPPAAAAPAPVPQPAPPPSVRPATPRVTSPASALDDPAAAPPAAAATRPATRPPAPRPPRPPRPVAAAPAPDAAPAAAGSTGVPRLRLEAAELPSTARPAAAGSPGAPTTGTVPAAPPAAPGAAAPAAAAGPQLPASAPGDLSVVRSMDDVLAEDRRLRSLEAELKSLLEISKANQATMVQLQERLAQAEQERYRNPLVYVLGVGFLLALMAALYLWQRQRRMEQEAAERWADMQAAAQQAAAPVSAAAPLVVASAPAALAPAHPDESVPAALTPTPTPYRPAHEPDRSEFSNSFSSSLRSVSTEELFDIQQQADFFVVLGQYEQAITLLSTHIEENRDTSALAYLDLLSIYHKLGLRPQFDELRRRFSETFNATVPVFDSFNERGRALVDYPQVLEEISAVWPKPDAMLMIEDLVFRNPGQSPADAFDMEAYRDLMLLYSVARLVVMWSNSTGGEQVPTRLSSSFGALSEPPSMPAPVSAATTPLDLDLVLDDLPAELPGAAPAARRSPPPSQRLQSVTRLEDAPTLPPLIDDDELLGPLGIRKDEPPRS